MDARGLGLGHAGRGIGRVIVELLEGFARIGAQLNVAGPDVVRRHLGPTLRFIERPARQWNHVLTAGDLPGDRILRLGPTMPGPLDARSVACCYDLMPLKMPHEHFPLRTRLRHPLAWPALRRSFDIFPRVHRVWSISRASALDLARMLGLPPARIDVVPLAAPAWARPAGAAEMKAARAKHGLEGRFILWVLSGLNYNKNHEGMLRAIAAAPALPPVVVVGSFSQYPSALARFERSARAAGARCRHIGRVSDEELRALLTAASCVAVPSSDEGYGLPVAEGLACGALVVANDIPVLRELAHPRVRYADAHDAPAFGAALLAASASPGGDGPPPARTWDDVAREVYALLTV